MIIDGCLFFQESPLPPSIPSLFNLICFSTPINLSFKSSLSVEAFGVTVLFVLLWSLSVVIWCCSPDFESPTVTLTITPWFSSGFSNHFLTNSWMSNVTGEVCRVSIIFEPSDLVIGSPWTSYFSTSNKNTSRYLGKVNKLFEGELLSVSLVPTRFSVDSEFCVSHWLLRQLLIILSLWIWNSAPLIASATTGFVNCSLVRLNFICTEKNGLCSCTFFDVGGRVYSRLAGTSSGSPRGGIQI